MINQEEDESVSNQPENIEKFESRKKLNKVRSMKLQRLRSSSRGRRKPQYDNLSILSSLVGTETSEQPTLIEVTDASPNYMKATTSSHAKDSFQVIFFIKSEN